MHGSKLQIQPANTHLDSAIHTVLGAVKRQAQKRQSRQGARSGVPSVRRRTAPRRVKLTSAGQPVLGNVEKDHSAGLVGTSR